MAVLYAALDVHMQFKGSKNITINNITTKSWPKQIIRCQKRINTTLEMTLSMVASVEEYVVNNTWVDK